VHAPGALENRGGAVTEEGKVHSLTDALTRSTTTIAATTAAATTTTTIPIARLVGQQQLAVLP
jgi:hypothetical protein